MVFDLGEVMQRKEERESARLLAFEFAFNVRWARLVGDAMGLDGKTIALQVAERPVEAVFESLNADPHLVQQMRIEPDRQVRAEHGNPEPYRMA
jgi:hypothetical protein